MQLNQETTVQAPTLTKDEILILRSALFAEECSNHTMIKNCEFLLSLVKQDEPKEQTRKLIENYKKRNEDLTALSEKIYKFHR